MGWGGGECPSNPNLVGAESPQYHRNGGELGGAEKHESAWIIWAIRFPITWTKIRISNKNWSDPSFWSACDSPILLLCSKVIYSIRSKYEEIYDMSSSEKWQFKKQLSLAIFDTALFIYQIAVS